MYNKDTFVYSAPTVNKQPCGDRFKLIIPYAGQSITCEWMWFNLTKKEAYFTCRKVGTFVAYFFLFWWHVEQKLENKVVGKSQVLFYDIKKCLAAML